MFVLKCSSEHWRDSVFVRTSSSSAPTTTSRTSSISATTATRSTLRYATLSSDPPSTTSPDTCLRRSSGWLTHPACTTEPTPPVTARRWVHRDLQALTGPSSPGPFQPLCMSAQMLVVISVMSLSSYTAKNILHEKFLHRKIKWKLQENRFSFRKMRIDSSTNPSFNSW